MRLVDIRFWQWLFLSILLGAVVGALWYFQDQEMDLARETRINTEEFVRLVEQHAMDGGPQLTNIQVHAPRKLGTGMVAPVEFTWRDRINGQTLRRENVRAWADTPVPLSSARNTSGLPSTVQQFLDQASKSNPGLSYGNALSDYPWYPFAKAMIFSVGAFGIIVPMLLSLLHAANVIQKSERPTTSLASVKTAKSAPKVATGPTRADMDDLATLNAKLEDNVADMLMKHEDPDDAADRKAEQRLIRKLNNQPDVDEHAANQQQEDKDFVGEFYPVARPHGHKDDEPKKPDAKK